MSKTVVQHDPPASERRVRLAPAITNRAALVGDRHLTERHAPTPPDPEGTVSGVEGLASGSAQLVVKRGPNAGSRFVLDRPSVSAGRHPGSDIFLDDITVSRHHAEFRLESRRFHIVDTGSLNGTRVNGQPVDAAALANGDEIQIGKFRLVFLAAPTPG